MRQPLVVATAGLALIVLWSVATVHVNYKNRWTGLFCIGQYHPVPPPLRANSYVFPKSTGFDGQFYRDIAHDPWNQRGFGQYTDDARLRYRRILLPLLANVLAFGRDQWIDAVYICLEWFSAFLGAYWVGRYAQLQGRSAWWGLAYFLLPSTLIALDRMLTDLPFTTLCVGFFYFAYRKNFPGMFVAAMLACLTREMGVILVGGYTAHLLWRRDFRRAIILCGALIPFGVWYLVESHFTSGVSLPYACCSYPGSSIINAMRTPFPYPLPAVIAHSVQAFDVLSLLGFVICSILVLRVASGQKGEQSGRIWVGTGFVLLAVMASCIPDSFNDAYDYGRQYSPIPVLLLFAAIAERNVILLAPVALITWRVAVQVLPQASAIVRSI
jgi:hypothetical protein